MPRPYLVLVLLLAAAPLRAQQDPETFDRSALPPHPSTFVEQQIAAMIAAHHAGDVADAARIQLKLAAYYASAGDEARARLARARAAAAGATAAGAAAAAAADRPATTPASPAGRTSTPAPQTTPALPGGFSGSYYAMVHGSLYSWDFAADGTYMFRRVASGSGTSAGVTERGRYAVAGSSIRLTPTRTASAYSTPTVGGRGTALGAGSDAGGATRTVAFRLLSGGRAGMELDGVRYTLRSW